MPPPIVGQVSDTTSFVNEVTSCSLDVSQYKAETYTHSMLTSISPNVKLSACNRKNVPPIMHIALTNSANRTISLILDSSTRVVLSNGNNKEEPKSIQALPSDIVVIAEVDHGLDSVRRPRFLRASNLHGLLQMRPDREETK